MNMNLTRGLQHLLLTVMGAVGLLASASQAREWRRPEWNCSVQLPDEAGWTFTEGQTAGTAGVSGEHASPGRRLGFSAVLLADRGSAHETIAGLEQVFTEALPRAPDGPPPVPRVRKFDFDGHPAIELTCVIGPPTARCLIAERHIVTGPIAYTLRCSTPGPSLQADPELTAFMDSFRFVKTPSPPPNAGGSRLPVMVGGLVAVGAALAAILIVIRKRQAEGRAG